MAFLFLVHTSIFQAQACGITHFLSTFVIHSHLLLLSFLQSSANLGLMTFLVFINGITRESALRLTDEERYICCNMSYILQGWVFLGGSTSRFVHQLNMVQAAFHVFSPKIFAVDLCLFQYNSLGSWHIFDMCFT